MSEEQTCADAAIISIESVLEKVDSETSAVLKKAIEQIKEYIQEVDESVNFFLRYVEELEEDLELN